MEICLKSTWGTVCDNFFGTTGAQVVCRQLGYPASGIDNLVCLICDQNTILAYYDQFVGAIPHRMAYFGQGSGPVHIGAAQCNGSEQRIVDCTITTENNCVRDHSEDAGVECSGEVI